MKRKSLIVVTVVWSLISVVAFLVLSAQASPREDNWNPKITATVTATPTPTRTPTPTAFTATMNVEPVATTMLTGGTIDVVVSIKVSAGCHYPIYELILTQEGADVPLLEYLTPITDTVGSGVTTPFTYTLKANQAGSLSFRGVAYGERYCGDSWNWGYVSGVSEFVTVVSPESELYLPILRDN